MTDWNHRFEFEGNNEVQLMVREKVREMVRAQKVAFEKLGGPVKIVSQRLSEDNNSLVVTWERA